MPSKRLADYIERITSLNQRPSKPSNRPFNNATAKNPPLLRPHGVNRILLYPGSFNPPHQGHLDLLKHVFENAGVDINIIAAIIVITDDERLTLKMETRDNAVVIPKDKRVKLWRGDGIPVDWAWVYDGSEANWARLRARLTKEVQKDHMELKFIVLNGPDGVTADRGFNPESWNCADSITSDISRPVDFRYPSTLRQLAGCSPWERLKIDRTRLEQQIRAKLRGQQTSGQNAPKSLENRKLTAKQSSKKYWPRLSKISASSGSAASSGLSLRASSDSYLTIQRSNPQMHLVLQKSAA